MKHEKTCQFTSTIVPAPILAIVLTSASLSPVLAQQSLEGDYVGLASFASDGAVSPVELGILAQLNRRFVGQIPFESDEIAFSGTIATSDKCQIVFDAGDGSMLLNWTNFGNGAAVLTGDGVVINHEEQFTAGFLRPFNELGIDWGEDLRGTAAFVSAIDGSRSSFPLGLSGVAAGLFGGAITMPDPLDFVGTSSRSGDVVIVGVSDSRILTIAGQVKINERGEPASIVGEYVIETAQGKLIDKGSWTGEVIDL